MTACHSSASMSRFGCRGLVLKGGQIVDASLVNVLRNRNTRDENKQIKEGETPDGWDDKPNMKRQKDEDARWIKKHGKSHYGYKNHINVDKAHKLFGAMR